MRRFLHIASVQYMSIKSKISNGLLKREVTGGRESCSNIFLRKISRRLLDCHYPKKFCNTSSSDNIAAIKTAK